MRTNNYIISSKDKNRIIVPQYHGFDWGDFKVLVRPSGIRRLLQQWPYFTGNDVNLNITVKTYSHESKEFAYSWECNYFGSDDIAQCIARGDKNFIGNPQNMVEEKIKIESLAFWGQHIIELEVVYPIKEESKRYRKRIVVFHTIESDAFTIKVIIAVAGVIGIIIGVVLGWVLGC